MLEALKHGKLSREQENMEDILTSNVFGILQYYPEYLIKYLSLAETPEGEKPLSNLSQEKIARVICDFWPPLKEEGCEFCEPDVLVTFICENGEKTLVLIEAKYKSGKSSFSDDEDEDIPDEKVQKAAKDQLAKEWQNLKAKSGNCQAYLVFTTADFSIPREQIEESQQELIKKAKTKGDILWLSWRPLPSLISNSSYQLLRDLAEILEKRFNFLIFDGIKAPFQTANVAWSFSRTA